MDMECVKVYFLLELFQRYIVMIKVRIKGAVAPTLNANGFNFKKLNLINQSLQSLNAESIDNRAIANNAILSLLFFILSLL